MSTDGWLTDARVSYDTVAENYADQVRDYLAEGAPRADPYVRADLALFAELVRAGHPDPSQRRAEDQGLAGDGPVADVGCGPGFITAHLQKRGLDMRGIDLSPGMIEVARREHPGIGFSVGSMTDLGLPDASLAGLIAWYSLIHIPDDAVGEVLAEFHRVLRPGAPVLFGFHAGDSSTLKTSGYGGLPMKIYVHRRTPAKLGQWLAAAGFTVEAEKTFPPSSGSIFARRS